VTAQACVVRFEDADGTVHAATVTASTLYEAVALAVAAFRTQPSTPPIPHAALLTVEVRSPVVAHRVTLQAARRWAARPATSPADKLQRDRLRRLLAT
jgi:hypothetical protein